MPKTSIKVRAGQAQFLNSEPMLTIDKKMEVFVDDNIV